MAIDLQILIAAVIALLTIGLAYIDIPLIGPIVRLVGVFVVPGWLFTNVLFVNRKEPDHETRFILVFGLGATLVALEWVILPLIGVRMSRESVALAGAVTSVLLAGGLVLRLQTGHSDLGKITVRSALPLSIIATLVIYIFVPLHRPVVKESYTEFYIAPSSGTLEYPTAKMNLVITSHEEKAHTYTVFCKDNSGSERRLAESIIEPEASFVIELLVPPPQPGSSSKMQLSLYREGDDTPYRWVELIGASCARLSVDGGA